MKKQQNSKSRIVRVAMVMLLVLATAWIVLHGRVTTTKADLTEGKCGGCRYATECLGKVPENQADGTASCGTAPKTGGCHEE